MRNEQYESFVVRLLVRTRSGAIISGQVVHVASGRKVRFTELDAVPSLIREQLM